MSTPIVWTPKVTQIRCSECGLVETLNRPLNDAEAEQARREHLATHR